MFFRNWFYLYIKSTAAEAVFERHIAKLGEPYRAQYPFPGLRRVADFALHLRKIVIEIDGASHNTPDQRRKDLTTSIALEKNGWKVVRLTNEAVLRHDFAFTEEHLSHLLAIRPNLAELEAALLELPEPVGKQSKRRARRKAPGPKSARRPQ